MEDPDVLAELAAAARVYARTKKAHEAAAKAARELVLASLQAGHSVPKVAKAAPFTYAYVRDIAEDNGIPRDQRKARYPKPPIPGFGEIGIGDTPEEAMRNAGPIEPDA